MTLRSAVPKPSWLLATLLTLAAFGAANAVAQPAAQTGAAESAATWLAFTKDLVSTLESAAKIVALIIGGIWTYNKFIRERSGNPRAEVSHQATVRAIEEADAYLVNVEVRLKNIGSVLLPVELVWTSVRQVLPLTAETKRDLDARNTRQVPPATAEGGEAGDRGKIPWTELDRKTWQWEAGESEIEPGESQTNHCEFVVPATVETVQLYTYFKNSLKRDREIGWTQRTLIDIAPAASPRAEAEKAGGGEEATE